MEQKINYSNSINWEAVIKKEARGINDDDDLGEVQSIGPNYIITMKGLVYKKTYYIPKRLAEGFDGHNLWVKISKEEANRLFVRETPPTVEEYHKYRTGAISIDTSLAAGIQTPEVPLDIESRVPVIERKMTVRASENEPPVLDWDNIVHKNVRTDDNQSVGNVAAITSGSIVVTSIGARDEYYIPKSYVEKYDGAEVFLNIPRIAVSGFKI
jgi:hypothetical protein